MIPSSAATATPRASGTRIRPGSGRAGVLGSHLPWGDPRRGWDFVSTGHGDVPWEDAFRALAAIGYSGPISIEWEDAGKLSTIKF